MWNWLDGLAFFSSNMENDSIKPLNQWHFKWKVDDLGENQENDPSWQDTSLNEIDRSPQFYYLASLALFYHQLHATKYFFLRHYYVSDYLPGSDFLISVATTLIWKPLPHADLSSIQLILNILLLFSLLGGLQIVLH